MATVDKSDAWLEVRKLREEMRDSEKEQYKKLNEAWCLVSASERSASDYEELANYFFSPLTFMAKLAHKGEYPPPEMLVWLSHRIDAYLNEKGSMTLEEAFFGNKTRGKHGGSYAARERSAKMKFDMIMKLGKMRSEHPGLSLRGAVNLALAEEVFADPDDCIDIDTVLRTLRDRGYTQELFANEDAGMWYFEVAGEKL